MDQYINILQTLNQWHSERLVDERPYVADNSGSTGHPERARSPRGSLIRIRAELLFL